MVYAVYTTESFNKEVEKLSLSDKEIIHKIFLQLKENPYVGDQIRYRFFREKRVREKRVYYLSQFHNTHLEDKPLYFLYVLSELL